MPPEFVELDGQKYVPDETDSTKAKVGEDGKPVPFVDKKPENQPLDASKASMEDLVKVNPGMAKFFEDFNSMKKSIADRDAADAQKAEADAAKNGEWQKLAEDRAGKLTDAEGKIAQKDEMLGKYVDTTKKILETMIASIPADRRSLIPENFSPREKLEYIVANAKLLGATTSFDGKIPKSDDTPTGSEEDKMVTRIDELTKKGTNRTSAETAELRQLGIKLTELRRKKAEEGK